MKAGAALILVSAILAVVAMTPATSHAATDLGQFCWVLPFADAPVLRVAVQQMDGPERVFSLNARLRSATYQLLGAGTATFDQLPNPTLLTFSLTFAASLFGGPAADARGSVWYARLDPWTLNGDVDIQWVGANPYNVNIPIYFSQTCPVTGAAATDPAQRKAVE